MFFFGVARFVLKLFPFLLLRLNLNKTSALVAIIPVIFYTFIAGLGVEAPCFWIGEKTCMMPFWWGSFLAGAKSTKNCRANVC